MGPETTWILLRAAGTVALAALTVAVAAGLVGPALTHPALRGAVVAIHRSAAVTGLALTLGHVVLSVLDPWVDISVAAALVPGASAWQPVWVGVGSVALHLLLVVALSSAARARGPRAWWTLHALTYPAWLLSVAHALALGTDSWRQPYLGAGLLGAALVLAAAGLRVSAAVRGRPAGVPVAPTLEKSPR